MGAIGAFVGPSTVLLVALATFFVGGLWALVLVAQRRQLRHAGNSIFLMCTSFEQHRTQTTSLGRLPYGVAIALGTMAVMVILH